MIEFLIANLMQFNLTKLSTGNYSELFGTTESLRENFNNLLLHNRRIYHL